MNKKIYIYLFLSICILLILTSCGNNISNEYLETEPLHSADDIISESDYVEELTSTEEQQLEIFTAQIPAAFKANDASTFANLIATDNFNIVTVYGGEGVVYKVAHQNKDHLKIKDGELVY